MKKVILLVCFFTVCMLLYSRPFKIIAKNNPTVTTHTLQSGKLILGFTDFGGGMINQVILPGVGDITAEATKQYGRGCQTSLRDQAHGGVYNPTQAGFNETLGTECELIKTPGKILVKPRGCALWYGDGRYDFTEWENIGADFNLNDKGNTDEDGLDESNLAGKQATEVFSEFDYYGTYEDFLGKFGIKTAVVRHYEEFRFIRPPGHCLNQFREGTKCYNSKGIDSDISVKYPAGVFKGTDKDINNAIISFIFRNDTTKWYPKYRHLQRNNGEWIIQSRVIKQEEKTFEAQSKNNAINDVELYKKIIIISDSANINAGNALGFYYPNSEINKFCIVGARDKDESIIYKDARTNAVITIDVPFVARPPFAQYGFRTMIKGLINKTRLPSGTHEKYRSEYYVLYGTPKKIMDAIKEIDRIN